MKFIRLFVVILIIGLVSCENPNNTTNYYTNESEGYEIGDIGPSGVGIVFYTKDNGEHGLEVAPNNWSGSIGDPSVSWASDTLESTLCGDTYRWLGTGLTNSNTIISHPDHTTSAASICREYNGGTLNDWYLPSIDELHRLEKHKHLTDIAYDRYWTSTEYSSANAYCVQLIDGSYLTVDKGYSYYVRPIRSF